MIERELITGSGSIRYWISEKVRQDRTTLFFLHGLTASHDLFVNQTEFFAEYCNVICWDAPAHGLSRPYKDFTYEKAAKGAVQILKENDITEAVFIGQSMGGFITQSVIRRFPEYVKGFVSIDSCPFGEKYYSKSDRWWLKQIEWMAALFPDKTLRRLIAKQCTRADKSYRNMYQMLSFYEKKELCHLLGIGYAGFLEDNCDMKITCPVMLIVGEYDITGNVKKYNEEWANDLGITVTWIKNAAHNSNDDRPEQVNKYIKEFIGRLQ